MARQSTLTVVSEIVAWPIALGCLPLIVLGPGGVATIIAVVLVLWL